MAFLLLVNLHPEPHQGLPIRRESIPEPATLNIISEYSIFWKISQTLGGGGGWGKTYRLMSFGGEEKYEKGEEQKMR
jgi:hypothetical protein